MKVLALLAGHKDHEIDKAIKLDGRWFPKAAVDQELTADDGATVLVFKSWFVRKNQQLVKDELGIAVNRGIRVGGELVFQGNAGKLGSQVTRAMATDDELDALFEKLVADGMSERGASREVRQQFKGRI